MLGHALLPPPIVEIRIPVAKALKNFVRCWDDVRGNLFDKWESNLPGFE